MILDEIFAHKRTEVDERKQQLPLAEVQAHVDDARPPRDFRKALRQDGISLIAEIKRASPVKGTFLDTFDPVDLAALYEQGGARAISVLTDERYFKGHLDDLSTVRKSVAVPCLRKEFIIDAYQIYEARAANADAILLIVRMLSDEQLRDFHELAESLGMGVLVETHDAKEIERALQSGARIVGINNRDLATFHVDIRTTLELKKLVPGGIILVSESGIHSREHVRMLEDGGVDAILVGEALVTSRNIMQTLKEFLGRDAS